MDRFCVIPKSELRARVKEETNWGLRSEIMREGRPKSFQT